MGLTIKTPTAGGGWVTEEALRTVPCPVPGLAVTLIGSQQDPDVPAYWTLTHIRSGLAVSIIEVGPDDERIAQVALDLAEIDWTLSGDEIRALPGAGELVHSVNRRWDSRPWTRGGDGCDLEAS